MTWVIGCRFECIANDFEKILTWCLPESYTKVAQTRLFSRKNDLRGAITIKNHPWNKILLPDVVQGVIKTHSPNDISLCFREKRRIRDSFAEATESREVFREFQFFCKSLCGKHFYGTKKSQSVDWLKFIW